jgi:hypothetical protein
MRDGLRAQVLTLVDKYYAAEERIISREEQGRAG